MSTRAPRISIAVLATLMAVALTTPSALDEVAEATAPTAASCNGNNAFCGYVFHVKNGATTVLPSKSIGAHYGAGWSIPASSNNSTGVGFCLNDQFFGVPVGTVIERPLAPAWTTAQISTAGYLLAHFAGDRVSPYQPIEIDGTGEFPGFTTRQRYAAVHLALLSVLPNWAGGSGYSPLIDPTTMQLFNDVGGTVPSSQQVIAPLVEAMVTAATDHHAGGSPVVLDVVNVAGLVTVTATKDGLPVADLPIWPDTTAGVTFSGTITRQAFVNTQLLSWPSLDYSTTLSGAGVTDAAGQAQFTVTRAALALGLTFTTEEAPGRLHNYGDGLNSQDNLTWLSGDIRRSSIHLFSEPTAIITTQISNGTPVVGETISDAVLLDAMDPGVTAEVQLQLFDLTLDPTGAGTPLLDVTVDGLGNGTTSGLAPWTITLAQAGHTLGYRERLLTTSDGMTVAPFDWSTLGIASETATVQGLVTAETHLRKTVSGDGTTWFNVQAGSVPSYGPAAAPADPAAGSHDDGTPDQGDAVPVFSTGTSVSFRYEVWLDPTSSGVVLFDNDTTGVVTDDNGTPDDTTDDFQPQYTTGDDGDGVLELDETWVYAATDARVAMAGETYANYGAIPSGEAHRSTNLSGPSEGATTPRRDPSGYIVPSLQTSVAAAVDDGRTISPAGGEMIDTVTYTNLVPGQTVTIAGELQFRRDDGTVTPTGITGVATITPATANGSADVTFTVPPNTGPGTFVAYESVSFNGIPVAEHRDPDDSAQTFAIVRPTVTTTVRNPDDAGQFLAPTGGTMVDEACFTDLHGTTIATIAGALQRRLDDATVQPTGITASATFNVSDPAGCVDVTFTVPADLEGGTFVVFEELIVDGVVVAGHRDPNDVNQTFVKRSPIEVTTEACHSQVTTANGAPMGMTCDRITVHGDPGDVITGTSTAYPWVNGSRACSQAGAVAAWRVTVGPNGVGTAETETVAVPVGASWEWIETASASDGRRFARHCATSPRETSESFVMRRGGGGGNDIPQAGIDAWLVVRLASAVLAAGTVALLPARRRRRSVRA
ncbi:MAG: VaFE repeat-containing surface-anchored protein [Ilumatobacteraceae bacterium]